MYEHFESTRFLPRIYPSQSAAMATKRPLHLPFTPQTPTASENQAYLYNDKNKFPVQ
jgi:hypothetical protein